MIDSGRPLAILTEESEHQLSVLRRGLKRAAGFALYVVVAKDLGRAEALRRLRAWSGLSGVPELHFFPEGEPGARAVDTFLAARDTAHALTGAVIPDTEALIDVEGGNALAALNVARDVLGEIIDGPLVLVVSPEREGDLARRAPDLFDVRAGTVAVEARAVEPGPILVATIAQEEGGPARPAVELQAEAESLRALAATEDPPLGALADAWVRLGRQFLERGEIGEAREASKAAQQLAERGGYTSGVAEGLALEARTLDSIDRLDDARACYERSLALQEKLGDRQALASTYDQLGHLAYRRGQLNEAQSSYENSLATFEDLGYRLDVAWCYLELASVALARGDLDKAHTWCKRSLTIYVELGDRSSGLALTYNQLALVAHALGKLDEAQAWHTKSLAIQQELGDRSGQAESYGMLGSTAQVRGELDKAKAWYEKSLAIYEELGDRPNIAVSYHRLGTVAQAKGELDDAQACHEKELAIAEELGNRLTVASSYHELGVVALARGDLDKARLCHARSLAIYEKLGNRPGMAQIYQHLGTVAQMRGRFDKARAFYEKELALHEELGNRSNVAMSYSRLATVAQALGKLDQAQALYEKSLAIYEELGDRTNIAVSYGELGVLAEERGDPTQALDWMTRAASLLPEFPHPLTGFVADELARLTAAQGMPALEASWQRVTGHALPAHVRSYIEAHLPLPGAAGTQG